MLVYKHKFLSLRCLSYDIQGRDFLAGVPESLQPFVPIDTFSLDDVNKNILKKTVNFIHKRGHLG